MRCVHQAVVLSLVVAIGAAGGAGVQLTAQDWPQFRGPTGQGLSDVRDVPLRWSETENVRWRVAVDGNGWSSPALSNGRVWLTTAVEVAAEGRRAGALSLRALAFDAETGARLVDIEVFRLTPRRLLNPKNSFASATPIIDGERVYVHFGADGTAAISMTGEVLWRARFPYESQHGGGGSPTLYRDLLIINCDGNDIDAYVTAIDTRTGKERWRRQRRKPSDQAYTTPLVVTVDGRDQVVSVGAYRTEAYDPLTGRDIWHVTYDDGFSNVPRPVFGHGLVFIATGFQQPTLIAVRPDGSGNVTRTHVVWTLTRGAPLTPSPLLVGDELYVVSDTGILTLVEARTGRVVYQQRLGGTYSASPLFAGGRIYVLNEDGQTTVLAPGPTFTRLAVNQLDGVTLASMAPAHGALFVRSRSALYRVGP